MRALWGWVGRGVAGISLPGWILIFLTVIYTEVLTWFSYLRYLGFLTNAWDLGIFQQALWNSGHGGGLLQYTVELPWNPSGSFLGVHFSPILLLIVPIYTAVPSPATLMALQAAAVAASAFPMYRLAERRIGRWPGLTLSALFIMSPQMIGGVLFDFHVEAFLPLFALTLWTAWEERRYRLAVLAAVLLLGTIEYAPVLLGGIAFGFFVRRIYAGLRAPHGTTILARVRPAWRPLAIAAASIPLTLVMFSLPKLVAPTTPPVSQVGPLGGSVAQILANTFLHAQLILPAIEVYGAHKVAYLQALWWSGLFAWPIGFVDALAAFPWIFIALVSVDPNYSVSVGNQYAFLVVPFLFVGTASALQWLWRLGRRLLLRLPRGPRWLEGPMLRPLGPRLRAGGRHRRLPSWSRSHVAVVALLLLAVPSQIAFSPFSPQAHYSWIWAGHFPTTHDGYREKVLGFIPAGASVSAEPDLFPHLADRPNVYPYFVVGTQYVVFDVTSWWFTTALPPPMPPDEWINELRQNVTEPYGVLASADGVYLLERGYAGPPTYFQPYRATYGGTAFHVVNATIGSDRSAPAGTFVLPSLNSTIGALWRGSPLLVPPGVLSLSLWVRANPASSGSIQLVTSIQGATGALRVLGNATVSTAALGPGWSAITETLSVPYPTYIDISGFGTGTPPAVEFGGASIVQYAGPVTLGP